MSEDTAIAVQPTLASDQLLAVADAAEKRIEAVNKIKALALRVTNHQDWTDQQGKPYLQVSGAEKIARLFGISWRMDVPIREDHEDGHFSYTTKGYFSMGTAEIEVIGTRSSKDPFFVGKKDNPKPPSEIDRNDVKKASITNCIGNGITRLLGIRNLTWEEVNSGGVNRDKVGKVEYKTSKPAPDPASTETPKPAAQSVTGYVGSYTPKPAPPAKGPGTLSIDDQQGGETAFKFWSSSDVAGIGEEGHRYCKVTWEWRGEGKYRAKTIVKPIEWIEEAEHA